MKNINSKEKEVHKPEDVVRFFNEMSIARRNHDMFNPWEPFSHISADKIFTKDVLDKGLKLLRELRIEETQQEINRIELDELPKLKEHLLYLKKNN
ncbi:hypothetical protein Phi19:3_gp037 [Cellulophaga phage phi19:3]|uniref:Uncharacterized protein n=1 Tax=Cellulophaga phage phi19:3 TaxID=1327971 RepID=R9ZWG0_9CAUD|nr:hypothetical protein Phi19:3_gp037 [Cellulophaga phage phi19:3]AGO47441.1 hypothetical protein Phi19:3_gp037 [Cellulophaga phage phi19:3]